MYSCYIGNFYYAKSILFLFLLIFVRDGNFCIPEDKDEIWKYVNIFIKDPLEGLIKN